MLLDNNQVSHFDAKSTLSKPKVEVLPPEGNASLPSKFPKSPKDKQVKGRSLSLRTKATALAIAIGTLPVVAIGATAYYFANQSLTQRISSEQKDKAVSLTDKLSRFMLERYGDIQVLADLAIFKDAKLRSSPTVLLEQQKLFDKYLDAYKVYDNMALYGLDGNLIVQSSNGDSPGSISLPDYMQAAINTGKATISQPRISRIVGTKAYSVYLAAPLKDAAGQTIGILSTRVPMSNLKKVINASSEASDELYLIDPKGTIFMASEDDKVGENAYKRLINVDKAHNIGKPDTLVTSEVSANKPPEGRVVGFSPVKPLENTPNLNWDLALSASTNVAFKPQRDLLLTLAVGTGIAAVVVGALAAWLASRVTRPIQDAASAVEKIGEGELDTRISVSGRDEMAVLGSNINIMADQIQRRNQLSNLALAMRQSTDLDNALNTLVSEVRRIINAERVVIYRFRSDWGGYLSHESVLPGLPSALKEEANDSCISPELLEAYRQGRLVVNNDVTERDYHPDHKALLRRLQIRANLVTPIVQQGQLFGLMVAHHCTDTHVWQPEEINLLTEAAVQAGYAVGQIVFIDQKTKIAKLKDRLAEISLAMGKNLNFQEILDTAVKEVRDLLNTDRAIIYTFDDEWKGTIVAESVGDRWPKALGAKIHDPCFADRYVEKYQEGRVQATADISKAGLTPCHLNQLKPFEIKANLVAPILRNKELIGLLIVHQCDAPRSWDGDEVDLMRQLATQVGYTIEQTTMVERIEKARFEARTEADERAESQKQAREALQKSALDLLMAVDPVSRGDLTVRAQVTEDEIGTVADSYNSTIRSLRQIVEQVQTATKAVSQTTTGSETKVKNMASEAVLQVEAIANALVQIEAMSKSSRGVAARAKSATEKVQIANRVVQAGDAAMNRTVSSINSVQFTVAEAAKKVKQLGESSQKVSKVVKLIRNIAAQTNMLALNASIEAARAGEEGQGFAVVAEQVRALAQRSATATTEIGQIIEDIQAQTNEVVLAMESGTEQVNTSTQQVEEAKQQLSQIAKVSAQVNKLVQEIAQAAAQQTETSTKVGQTIQDVAVIANNTQEQSGSVADSFNDLLKVAQELQVTVGQFKVS
jgi:methyl-accepting chemotaxis protein PixJ